jgi:2-polyprenyl-3-methyl-5-hydroxy-6-metoxy-1,4-benzoquinol methylase
MLLLHHGKSHSVTLDYQNFGAIDVFQYACTICGYFTKTPDNKDLGTVRGNTTRFMNSLFHLWKCPQCSTIYSLDPIKFQDIYRNYPLNKRRLDFFASMTMRNLLKRLKRAGLRKRDLILDYGCGNGLFVTFLKKQGYSHAAGYDPYVREFSILPEDSQFDCVVSNDVIEHISDPRSMIQDCIKHLKPEGILYIGTSDSDGVEMDNIEPHVMRLHQPFHRIIFTRKTLNALASETGLELVNSYRRSYMDTIIPFANYRFLDELSKALGHNMNRMLNPAARMTLLRKPALWFYGFFGYLFPSAYEPAIILRRKIGVYVQNTSKIFTGQNERVPSEFSEEKR